MPNKLRFSATAIILVYCHLANLCYAQESLSEVFADRKVHTNSRKNRDQLVTRLREIEHQRDENTRRKAQKLGLTMRIEKENGGVMEIIDFKGDSPVYACTRNANAAITTGANLVHASPYHLDGSEIMVGIWDAGSVLATHEEFGTRVTVVDGSSVNSHATHVAGTLAAQGMRASAKGMAPAALVRSYHFSGYISEMTSAAATAANQFDSKIYISNHSWGFDEGWRSSSWNGNGTDQNAIEQEFGQYETTARNIDSHAYSSPYHLPFWAIGNDGLDNPFPGQSVTINGVTTNYNPTIHPPGDGDYRNGFDTIAAHGLAKNIIAVGSVDDAISFGVRDAAKATLHTLTSSGPTDDGRIKPDLMANGVSLSSTTSTSNTSYTTLSGTSMASPNAAGSALLVVDQYRRLFNSAMRASTLKSLLINTATDLGNPGPDYKFGWGLINTKAAVDLVREHHNHPSGSRIVENALTTATQIRTHSFNWDGASALNATIAWTDPAGTAVTTHDSRIPILVNDLNLKLIAPDGKQYFPYVMPFVGTWTVASMSERAIRGINNTDNVETVNIPNPGQIGTWTAEISYAGTLSNGAQEYGLVISGAADNSNTVKIQSPLGGETYYRNSTYNITWKSSVAGSISIMLLKNGSFHSMISTDTPNDGSFLWTVPSSLALGSDYTIRVRNFPNSTIIDNSGNVTIADFPLNSFNTALDNNTLIFTSGGNAPWFLQTTDSFLGGSALQSGAIGDRQTSSVYTTIAGPGTLTFRHKVSSEFARDFLDFYLNGVRNSGVVQRISGEVDWAFVSVAIPAGSSVVEWRYMKDSLEFAGGDFGRLDAVTFTSSLRPQIAVQKPDLTILADESTIEHFGSILAGESSSSVTYTIRNTGNANLTSLALSKRGLAQDDYILSSLATTSLAPGATTTFTITFAPSVVGQRYAALEIASNDNVQGTLNIELFGMGVDTNLEVSPSAHFISTGNIGGPFSPTSQIYTLFNRSSSALEWSASAVAPWLSLSSTSGIIAASASMQVSVSINSSANQLAADEYNTEISFTNHTNGSGSTARNASLIVSKLPQSITFESLQPVLDDAAPFTLTATANSSLPVTFVSSNTSVATVSGNTVTPVGAGSTVITASQSGNGIYSAAIPVQQTLEIIRSQPSAVPSGPYRVLLTQSLMLNGAGSIPSPGNTITHYTWDLNNDQIFDDVTGATPAAISYQALISSWGMADGTHPIHLRVTDSSGRISTSSTSVRLVSILSWDANHTAADRTDGAGAWLGGNQWWSGSENLNWVSGMSASFGNGGSGGAVTLASATNVNQLRFQSFTGTYTLGSSANAITIGGGILKNNGAGILTIESPVTLIAPQVWNNQAGTINVNRALNTAGHRLDIAGSTLIHFATASSIISGSGGITMNGSGRFFLSSSNTGAHTYTGTTILNGGLTLVHNNNIGNGNLILNGGIFEASVNHDFIRPLGTGNGEVQVIGGVSGFGQNANQTSNINFGNNANNEVIWGNTTFNPSVLALQSAQSQSNSTIHFLNRIDLNGTSRTVQVSSGTTGNASASLSGIVRNTVGSAGLIKTGNGRLNLNGNNSYNGGTTLSSGILQLGHGSALGATSGPLTVNGGILNLNNFSVAVGNLAGSGGTIANNASSAVTLTIGSSDGTGGTFSGLIANNTNSGTGAIGITKTGGGSIILAGANTYSGITSIQSGKLHIHGNQSSATGNVSVAANATLGGTGTLGGNANIAANGILEFHISTISANHNPLDFVSGKGLTFAGASTLAITSSSGAQPGIYTLVTGGNNIIGSPPSTLILPSGWDATVSISGNNLLLNLTSTNTTGPLHQFTISPINSPQSIGSAITGITLTAQDASNRTVTAFNGTVAFSGTAGITGNSASFVNGILNHVSVTPTIAGNNLSFIVTDLTSGKAGSSQFTVFSPYQSWANSFLPADASNPAHNNDGDTFTNLQEFAFGMSPTNPSSGSISYTPGGDVTNPGAPVSVNLNQGGVGIDFRAIFGRRKNHLAAGLTYTVQFSADFTSWVNSTENPSVLTGANSSGDIEAVSVPYPLFIQTASGFKKPTFFRIQVTLNQ